MYYDSMNCPKRALIYLTQKFQNDVIMEADSEEFILKRDVTNQTLIKMDRNLNTITGNNNFLYL